MTKERYDAPVAAQPLVELTKEQQQARAVYTQLGIALAALRVAHDQLPKCKKYLKHVQDEPYDVVSTVHNICVNIDDVIDVMKIVYGTTVTQGHNTLPVLFND